MTVDGRLMAMREAARRLQEENDRAETLRLKGDGGGGTSDGMEQRVSRLEKTVDQMSKDIGDMRVDVATLKENVRHLPTKPWMFTTLVGMLTALAAVVAIIVRFVPPAH